MTLKYTDQEIAQALVQVVGESPWEAVALAHGYLASIGGSTDEAAARVIFKHGPQTLKKSKELIAQARQRGLSTLLTERKRTGSAENPITKLFPAFITEQRFLELVEELRESRPSVDYNDDRGVRYSLTDFTLIEGDEELPVNIKNAGTRFENAQQLVGIEPDDCIPIPAYKAYGAIEKAPNLLYVISVDYALIRQLNGLLPQLFSRNEAIVWDLLNRYEGSHHKKAEDLFIYSMVKRHWGQLKGIAARNPFHVISARKSVRILQTKPQRTPGIGLKAWGTGASAEVNVHISIKSETTPWDTVSSRIRSAGIINVIEAVNRRRTEIVYDPEI
jgi:hypothetical protein